MSAITTTNWHEANQRYLMARLSVVREALTRHIARAQETQEGESDEAAEQTLSEAMDALSAPAALDSLCAAFGLSPFERDVLL